MKKILLTLALLLSPLFAHATNWYFVDCGNGAVAACAANIGSESNDGLTSSTPKQLSATALTKFKALAAGDTINFARGGAWDAVVWANAANTNCTKAAPCVIQDFTPSWLAATDSDSGGTVTYQATGLTDSGKAWTVNQWVGYSVTVLDARQAPQERQILSNTATTLTLAPGWGSPAVGGADANWESTPAAGTAYSLAGQKPILNNTAGGTTITFSTSGSSVHHEGYTIKNLDMRGGLMAVSTATSATTGTIVDSAQSWTTNQWVGYKVHIFKGTAVSSTDRTITANDATSITISGTWPGGTPNTTSQYIIYSASSAVTTFKDVWYFTMTGMLFGGNTGGFDCNGGVYPSSIASGTGDSEHYIIRGNQFRFNSGYGILAACTDTLIESNSFAHVGLSALDHNIYLDDAQKDASTLYAVSQQVIRNNTLRNAFLGAAGGCASDSIVIHGTKSNIIVEGNVLQEDTTTSSSQCEGIGLTSGYAGQVLFGIEGFTNVAVRNNVVMGYGTGIALDITTVGVVENNYIQSGFNTGSSPSGIAMRGKNFVPNTNYGDCTNSTICSVDVQPNAIRIINNTVVFDASVGSFPVGIRLNANIGDPKTGSNFVLASNIVYFAGGVSTAACFDTQNVTNAKFLQYDYNECFYAGTTGQWDLDATKTIQAHSLNTNPQLTSPQTKPDIPTGSPAKSAGSPTYSSRLGYGGVIRDGSPDIGAFEFGASGVVPGSQTRIGAQ